MKEKLAEYQRISIRYRGTKDPEEQRTLKLLRHERRHVEKQLFPNVFARLFYQLFFRDLRNDIVTTRAYKNRKHSSEQINYKLQRAGLVNRDVDISEKIRLGEKEFKIPITYQQNETEHLEHHVLVARGHDGMHDILGMLSSLKNEKNPELNRQHFFSAKEFPDLSTKEAYNLLSGRAIHREGKWMQLDLNDKDKDGNFRLKTFHAEYGFDLKQVLSKDPYKSLLSHADVDKITAELRQGERVALQSRFNGNSSLHYLEAAPQFKTVEVLNEHAKKPSISRAGSIGQAAKIIPVKPLKKLNQSRPRKIRTN